mgnify:CR=1 FL=1
MHAYDNGFEDEAQRIATVLRTLLHDGRNSHALLTQLGMKEKMHLLSSVDTYVPTNEIAYTGLIANRIGNSKGEYIPTSESQSKLSNKWFRFADWWSELVIDDKNNLFTREDIIRKISDSDGGAHVDPTLKEDYAKLTKHNSLGWHYEKSGEQIPFERNPAYSSVRQLATEVVESIAMHQLIRAQSSRKISRDWTAHYIDDIRYFFPTPPIDVFFTDKRVTKSEKRIMFRQIWYLRGGNNLEIFTLG